MPNHFELENNSFDDLLGVNAGDTSVNNAVDIQEDTQTVETSSTDTNEMDSMSDTTDSTTTDTQLDESGDFMTSFLSNYGIKDGKVTYENEDGSTEQVDFNSLDSAEKLNILKELTTPDLTRDEIETINYLRSNRVTIRDIVDYYSKKAVDEYIKANGQPAKQYTIDDFSDDELYIADVKAKFSDMTDEDIKADLESAKENQELFQKKIDTIRKRYKEIEDQEANEKIQAQEHEFNSFKTSLAEQLNSFNEISMDYKDSKADSLQIEDSEKDEIFRYILDRDSNGQSQFFKDLNNPRVLVELAWYALYGRDAFSSISNYWKGQLKSSRRTDTRPQTTVVKKDTDKKDNFATHRMVETSYGENLL